MEAVDNNNILQMLRDLAEIEFVKRIRSHFVVRDLDAPNPKYIRVGKNHDGGYIMLYDFDGVRNVYSGGINNDVSWDEGMISFTGGAADVFMYDHTIDALPKTHPKFHWSKTGLTGIYDPARPELETLPRLIDKNGHLDDHNMILKMDIEGAEYGIFEHIDDITIKRFKQIVLEFHGLLNGGLENAIGLALDKLNATHQLVHIHANNHSGYVIRSGLVLPDVVEAVYLRRSDYQFVKSQRFFPTSLDMPNHPGRPDINLGYCG